MFHWAKKWMRRDNGLQSLPRLLEPEGESTDQTVARPDAQMSSSFEPHEAIVNYPQAHSCKHCAKISFDARNPPDEAFGWSHYNQEFTIGTALRTDCPLFQSFFRSPTDGDDLDSTRNRLRNGLEKANDDHLIFYFAGRMLTSPMSVMFRSQPARHSPTHQPDESREAPPMFASCDLIKGRQHEGHLWPLIQRAHNNHDSSKYLLFHSSNGKPSHPDGAMEGMSVWIIVWVLISA